MKAREWWIIFERGFSTWISDKALYSADTTDEVHVREILPNTVTITRKELEDLFEKHHTAEREYGYDLYNADYILDALFASTVESRCDHEWRYIDQSYGLPDIKTCKKCGLDAPDAKTGEK